MFGQSMSSLPIVAAFATAAVAQLSGWSADEVSATMCSWMGMRAAVLRDTVYLDGGYIEWRPGFSDGSYGDVIKDTNTPGIVYTLNFSTPFNTTQNISAIFGQEAKGSSYPLYYDGALLGNDDEFFLYGGMLTDTLIRNLTQVEPDDDEGTRFNGYSYGIEKPAFAAGFYSYELTENTTRYLAYGGAANVPSENLAFYFSGLRSPNRSEIWYPTDVDSTQTTASVVSDTLITLNMATQGEEVWRNDTLPDETSGRATPELVWVPVGKQGILVALGGVVYPEFAEAGRYSDNQTTSEEQSPLFMSNIDIYDIASKEWYKQSTSGGPGVALAQGCAVMQPAKDYSSFNIYWYGGYDGLQSMNASVWSDDVWVLSLPSFTWTKVASGRTGMARAGHRCVMPYPDQMMVIGGTPTGSMDYLCVTDMIQIFNVSSAKWLDSYDPTVWGEYQVPSAVYKAIGGDESGGATSTAPATWDTSSLGSVFQTAYATSKITTYYPYPAATTTGSASTPTSTTKDKSGSGVPKFLAPLLGVVLGLLFLSSLVVGILLWRRRRLLKKNGGVSVVATDEHGNRIMSWINGQTGAEAKSETVTTTDELVNSMTPPPDVGGFHPVQQYLFPQQHHDRNHSMSQGATHYEVDNNEVVELPGKSPNRIPSPLPSFPTPGAAELSDTAMSPSDIVQRRFSRSSPHNTHSMGWSSIQATDQGSLVSSTSFARNIPPAPPSSESYATSSVAGSGLPPASTATNKRSAVRPDSTALPTPLARAYDAKELPATPPGEGPSSSSSQDDNNNNNNNNNNRPTGKLPRGDSDVSAFSERERSHLRQLSDPATVSTMDAVIAPNTNTTAAAARSHTAHGGRVGSPPILEEGAVAAANAGAAPQDVVSPPTGGETDGEDYVGSRLGPGDVSPVNVRSEPPAAAARRSAFRESDEDLGRSGDGRQ